MKRCAIWIGIIIGARSGELCSQAVRWYNLDERCHAMTIIGIIFFISSLLRSFVFFYTFLSFSRSSYSYLSPLLSTSTRSLTWMPKQALGCLLSATTSTNKNWNGPKSFFYGFHSNDSTLTHTQAHTHSVTNIRQITDRKPRRRMEWCVQYGDNMREPHAAYIDLLMFFD